MSCEWGVGESVLQHAGSGSEKPPNFLSRLKAGIGSFFAPPEDPEKRETEKVAGLFNLYTRMLGGIDTIPGTFPMGLSTESLIRPQDETPQKSTI